MQLNEIIAIILLGFIYVGFGVGLEACKWADAFGEQKEYLFLSPATLKRSTKMNWVGCILTWIGLGIISPGMFLFKCIWNLFHV